MLVRADDGGSDGIEVSMLFGMAVLFAGGSSNGSSRDRFRELVAGGKSFGS